MKKLFVANFKMKPVTATEAARLARAGDVNGVVIAPPFPFLPTVKNNIKKAVLGAQNIFWENPNHGGAFTGEVSAAMLKSLGVKYVIVGHSERRMYFSESEENIAKKVRVAYESGIMPIMCVGESNDVRKKGMATAKSFITQQLRRGLVNIATAKKIIIAYEPIWAIGTGNNDTPENAADMARHIMKVVKAHNPRLQVSVLYGGSVNSKNIAAFAREKNIAGFLVGGASVDVKELKTMIKIIFDAHE